MKNVSLRDAGREESKQLERERTARGAGRAAEATESCVNVINEITAG